MKQFQRKWFEKGIETARRIIDRFDTPNARLVLDAIPQSVDDVAGDFNIETFIETIARQVRENRRVYPPGFNLREVSVKLLVAATKIDRQRDLFDDECADSRHRRDEISDVTDLLREIALDIAGVPYLLHECHKDKLFNENGECRFCKVNAAATFSARLYRDYITDEFAFLDSGDVIEVEDALERLRNRFGDKESSDLKR